MYKLKTNRKTYLPVIGNKVAKIEEIFSQNHQ